MRILLVDDQPLIRVGFQTILETEPGLSVVGQAATGREAVRLAAELDPDVICMDVQMPDLDGLEATRAITAAGSRAAILILTTFDRDDFLFESLQAGASGFLLKTAEAEDLIGAVVALAKGEGLLAPEVTRRVLERFARRGAPVSGEGRARDDENVRDVGSSRNDSAAPAGPDGSSRPSQGYAQARLTAREHDVLRLVARGLSNAEIAEELVVGEATVKTHVSNVLMKLGLRDRVQAVVWAYENGLAGT
ncbi:response regulator [Granulicoccus sp. GXG6511]|uniref:response regulator n=1 Tax=Granulicoccus sp. GXG6511 TaxID=3381351 RepID=UPI003D7CB1BD